LPSNEFRILITFILKFLLLFAIYIGGAIVLGIVVGLAGGVARGSAGAAGIAGLIAAIAGFALVILVIWIALRLSLSSAAAVGSGEIGIGPSWSATKGAVWALLLYWILWWLFLVVVEGVCWAILMPGFMQTVMSMKQTAIASGGDQMENARAVFQMEKELFHAMGRQLPLIIGIGAVIGLVVYPLLICAAGVAWRMLTEGHSEAEHA